MHSIPVASDSQLDRKQHCICFYGFFVSAVWLEWEKQRHAHFRSMECSTPLRITEEKGKGTTKVLSASERARC